MSAGLVSVIIPTHNRASFILTALDSVLAQTYRPIECVVVDDGSSDNTQQVVGGWALKADLRFSLRYIQQENRGAPAARTRGLAESQGEFINFLDSDDYFLPEALQRKVDCLRSSGAPYCYDRGKRVDEEQNTLGYYGLPWSAHGGLLFLVYHFHTAGPLIRRSICQRIGPWDNSIKGHDEVEYFARLKLHGGRGVFLNETGHIVVEHRGPRIMSSNAPTDDYLLSRERILPVIRAAGSAFSNEANFLEEFLKLAYANNAAVASRQGNYATAAWNLRKAYEYGFRKWHVRSCLMASLILGERSVVPVYFRLRDSLHQALLRLRRRPPRDPVGEMYDLLKK